MRGDSDEHLWGIPVSAVNATGDEPTVRTADQAELAGLLRAKLQEEVTPLTCGDASCCSSDVAGHPDWGHGRNAHAICQVTPQFEHRAAVTSSLRESPVASIEIPAVKTAAVAFPPLTPFLTRSWLVATLPSCWQ